MIEKCETNLFSGMAKYGHRIGFCKSESQDTPHTQKRLFTVQLGYLDVLEVAKDKKAFWRLDLHIPYAINRMKTVGVGIKCPVATLLGLPGLGARLEMMILGFPDSILVSLKYAVTSTLILDECQGMVDV